MPQIDSETKSLVALGDLENIKIALRETKNIDFVKAIIDRAELLRIYRKQIGDTLEIQNEAGEIRIRAQRKAGELLIEQINHEGGRPKEKPLPEVRVSDLGFNYKESSHLQSIASIPEEIFEEHIAKTKENKKELTTVGVLTLAKSLKRKEEIEELKKIIESGIELPTGVYEVIVIDPPWPYGTNYNAIGRRAASPYPEMSLEELKNLEIPSAEDCILFLWTTHKFLRHSFDLIDSWGFRDVSIITWVKDQMGLGEWLRSQSEFCVMCVKGKPVVNLSNQTTVIHGPLREHSRKPDEFYQMVNELCIGRKLDYFSRETRKGWDSFGNQTSLFCEAQNELGR